MYCIRSIISKPRAKRKKKKKEKKTAAKGCRLLVVLLRDVDERGHLIPPFDVHHNVPQCGKGVVHVPRLHHADLPMQKENH